MELRHLFDRALRASFREPASGDDPVSPHLADLLIPFARTESVTPRHALRGGVVPRDPTALSAGHLG